MFIQNMYIRVIDTLRKPTNWRNKEKFYNLKKKDYYSTIKYTSIPENFIKLLNKFLDSYCGFNEKEIISETLS